MASDALSVTMSGSDRVALRSTWTNMMRDVEAPMTLADSTNASALMRTTSERTTRKYCGMKTTVIEMRRRQDAGPQAGLSAADRDRRDDREKEGGEGVDRVGDHDQHAVQPPAEVPGDEAEEDAEEHREGEGDDDREQRGLRAPDRAREHVVAAHRRAEQVLGLGGCCAPKSPSGPRS